jgi:glycerol kinase
MSGQKYIFALDRGAKSSRAMIIDASGKVVSITQKQFNQEFTQSSWIERCTRKIWPSQSGVAFEALTNADLIAPDIAIGITDQREPAIFWDRKTGEPICIAIVRQDEQTDTEERSRVRSVWRRVLTSAKNWELPG